MAQKCLDTGPISGPDEDKAEVFPRWDEQRWDTGDPGAVLWFCCYKKTLPCYTSHEWVSGVPSLPSRERHHFHQQNGPTFRTCPWQSTGVLLWVCAGMCSNTVFLGTFFFLLTPTSVCLFSLLLFHVLLKSYLLDNMKASDIFYLSFQDPMIYLLSLL